MGESLTASIEAKQAAMWRKGNLRWKLDDHQLEVNAAFEAWNARRQTPEYAEQVVAAGATMDDVWVEELARRFGKTAGWIVRMMAVALKRPGAALTYGTAFQKDIGEIIVPLAHMLSEDAPPECKPVYKGSHKEQSEGLYFPNGSLIKLVGVDLHPNALRGRFSDGVVLSEAAFMRGLETLVRAVLLPQFQRRPWAYLVLESSSPETVDHDFARVFVPDAKARGAYVMRTIDANTVISDADKAKYIRQAGGRGHVICEREYFCDVQRDPERTVFPEFKRATNVVKPRPMPQYAHCYTAADPAIQDMFGLVFGYWDVARQKLVIQRSWASRNAGTAEVAALVRATEYELWRDVRAYDAEAKTLKPQCATPDECAKWDATRAMQVAKGVFTKGMTMLPGPHGRVSDIDLSVMHGLSNDYGMFFAPAMKDDGRDASIYALRNAFEWIEIEEDSGPLADHCEKAVYTENRKDFERSPVYGHFDAADALRYLVRYVSSMRNLNPRPPATWGADAANMWVPPEKPNQAKRVLVPTTWRR